MIKIYTDGACKGNPGPGGWGVVLLYKEHEKCLHGGETHTTNNRMELTAAIQALQALTRPCQVQLYTDSQYLKKGITEWIHGWKRKKWKNSKKEPVKNADLWQTLDTLIQNHEIEWHWVKAHNGDFHNEKADELANLGITEHLRKMKA